MMSSLAMDNLLASIYLLIWVVTFLFYQRRNFFRFDAGTVIIGSYVLYAVISIFSLNDDLFAVTYKPLTVFPYVYLYTMLMIALSPTISMRRQNVTGIEDPHTRILQPMCWFFVACALMLIPSILGNFEEGVMKLFTDVDAGNDAYEEQKGETIDAGSAITNLPAIIFNATYDVIIFFSFYFLTLKKKPKFLILGLMMAIVVGVLLPIMKGQRGGVIYAIYTVIIAYMLLKQFYSKILSRFINIIGISAILVVMLPVVAITVSRFGDRNAGVTGYLNWYVGQGSIYFNNSALDPGGTRNGDRTMYLVKRMIDPSTPKNFVERRMKYHNLEIDDYYFTTFVGDFCIDFGPYIPVVIFLLFNFWVLTNVRARDGTMKLHQIFLIYFTMCICMQGGMTLFPYSDTSNLKIVVAAFIYAYLRVHESLLEKFPKKQSEENEYIEKNSQQDLFSLPET